MSLIKRLRERINRYHVALGVFLLLGLFLRLNNLGGDPLWKTEVYNSWAAKNFLAGNGFTHPSGQLYPRAWLTTTLPIAASFAVFGINEFAARLPSVVFGFSTIIVTYFLGKEVGQERTGLLSAGLVALSYWTISWDTTARMYAHSALFYTLAVFLVYRWYEIDGLQLKSRYLYALVPVSVLGLSNHILYSSIFPVAALFIGAVGLYTMRLKSENRRLMKQQKVTVLALSLVTLAVVLLHGLVWLQGYTPAWYNDAKGMFYYLKWVSRSVGAFFLPGMGAVLALKKPGNWLVVIAAAVPFAALSLLFAFKAPRFIYHLYPVILVLAALPVKLLLDIIDERLAATRISGYTDLIVILAVFVSVIALTSPLQTYSEMRESSYGMIGEKPDHRSPAQYIEKKSSEDEVVLSTAPLITEWYLAGQKVDYSLDPTEHVNSSGDEFNPRLGIKGLEGSEAEEIFSSSSGWVVADKNFDIKTKKSVRNAVLRNTEPVKSWEQVTLYRFN